MALPAGAALGQNTSPPDPASQRATPTATPGADEHKVDVVSTAQPRATATPKPVDAAIRYASVGETLRGIALQTGFALRDLAAKNLLARADGLLYGQKIQLPKPASGAALVYRAQPGDTPSLIAARFNVSPYAIRRANALACAGCVYPRQLLRVPQKAAAASPASAAPQPFSAIEISPARPHAGDVMVVRVTSTVPLSNVTGAFGSRPLRFVPVNGSNGRGFIALSGVGALDEPGLREVSARALTATSTPEEVHGKVQVPAYSYGYETVTVSKKLANLLDAATNQKELDDLAKIYSQWSSGQFWNAPFSQPISGARITSYFGARRSYNGGLLFGYHSGMDLSATVGTNVRAMAPGRVVAVQPFPVRGNVIIIDHGRGVMTTYCHLSQWKVKVGDFVQQNDVIAQSGNTGRSEGPHLHFELAVGGVTVDPREWLSKTLP